MYGRKQRSNGNLSPNTIQSKRIKRNEVIKIIDPNLKPIYDNPKPGEASKHQPYRKRLPGELLDFILDNSLAKEHLGYEPKTKVAEGFKDEIGWIKNNPKYWDYEPRVQLSSFRND